MKLPKAGIKGAKPLPGLPKASTNAPVH